MVTILTNEIQVWVLKFVDYITLELLNACCLLEGKTLPLQFMDEASRTGNTKTQKVTVILYVCLF